jgi:hypothetical protein
MSAVLPHLEITPQRPDWLAGAPGFEPGNGGIKSPNSVYSNNGHSEKTRDSGLFPINRLGGSSEWCALLARTAWCMLLHRRFRRSHIVGLFDCECQCSHSVPRLGRSYARRFARLRRSPGGSTARPARSAVRAPGSLLSESWRSTAPISSPLPSRGRGHLRVYFGQTCVASATVTADRLR